MLETSKELFERAKQSIPGGVNSPARAFNSVGGSPVFMEKAEGSILTDVDGKEYIDYVGSWGPMILGHAYEPVIEAVQETAAKSTSFGAPTELEVKMAELVKRMVPGVDKIRMVNSGTEACMSAIRVARGYTGRDKVIKFQGNYHGHGDSFLINAGSGALTLGTPSSPGVTEGTANDTLTADYNDLNSVKQLLNEFEDEVAAIIVEPVAGNMGCIPPQKGFLSGLRELCNGHDVVLIFDEVMTGFRVAQGGAQQRYGVTADLVTYGKIIGAGLPVGAFGGKEEIMQVVSPDGPVYQAGTLSGNPLAMIAGYTLLSELHENPVHYDELEEKTTYLYTGLSEVFTDYDVPVHLNRVGSMLGFFFTEEEVVNFETANTTDQELFKAFFHAMLKNGIYLPPSPFESLFLANSLTKEMLDQTLDAAGASIEQALNKI
ncbi:glutamate-1-semialdehyde 2,1-aminomutase [Aliifodinibius salicampi]|uniref:Glutamate-1-semialdehyde 2,1-aminomutase n=1 Tax=Fodinibius salicampi TaxID=1920655 RepID=A0ABT3PZ63_9BACT|nr:glutamate-1-semialdehyde 2,1-aminomutase [Fodinibius salicampi]MCW9713149.1 glutamate-1-semialdehyde 2,1-aminomutase [Fodinibius salicampi]